MRYSCRQPARAGLYWASVAVAALVCVSALAAEKKGPSVPPDPAVVPPAKPPKEHHEASAIRAGEVAFVRAFNRGDAKAVAALWTPDGSLADDQGRLFKGRRAIEDEYAAFFKEHQGQRLKSPSSPSNCLPRTRPWKTAWPGVMTKDGTPPVASRYTAVHVRQGGKWLMASVRESGIELPSNYDQLQDFEWLVGTWETKADDTAVHTTVRWLPGQEFPGARVSVLKGGVQESSGLQIIGWDAQAGKVRLLVLRLLGRPRHGPVDARGRWLAHRRRPACWPTARRLRPETT